LLLDAGFSYATSASPRILWPGAGEGRARKPLLRAHPLLEDGVIVGRAFGRRLAHARLEGTAPIASWGIVQLEGASFLDAARAWDRGAGRGASEILHDAGVGLRLRGPTGTGEVRLDAAWGLADRAHALSIAWSPL
jgi:hypothetical protein